MTVWRYEISLLVLKKLIVLVTNRLINDPKSCWLDIFSD